MATLQNEMIAAYEFKGFYWAPEGVVPALQAAYPEHEVSDTALTEEALVELATKLGIDREDEGSFTGEVFPKPLGYKEVALIPLRGRDC